jgi:hypothetical protein
MYLEGKAKATSVHIIRPHPDRLERTLLRQRPGLLYRSVPFFSASYTLKPSIASAGIRATLPRLSYHVAVKRDTSGARVSNLGRKFDGSPS